MSMVSSVVQVIMILWYYDFLDVLVSSEPIYVAQSVAMLSFGQRFKLKAIGVFCQVCSISSIQHQAATDSSGMDLMEWSNVTGGWMDLRDPIDWFDWIDQIGRIDCRDWMGQIDQMDQKGLVRW